MGGIGAWEKMFTSHVLSSSSQLISPCSVGEACGVNKVISVKVKQDLGSSPGWAAMSSVHLGGMPKILCAIFLICKIRILMATPQVDR